LNAIQTVLVVDDEKQNRMLLAELIKDDCRVILAKNGQQALERAREQHPDLILLDVMMPKKSGFEVCEALRADPARAGLLIVMLTAKGRDTEVAKGLALGADAYVTKPFSTKDLLAKVKEMLAR
jgi:CheY-like chemotaxis protein